VENWSDYVETIAGCLHAMVATDRSGAVLPIGDAMAAWVAMTHATAERDGQLYIIGNGGSAGMASHMAADACKNGHLRALAFNDAAMLTATANDLAYDQVFALPLQRLARPGDLVIAISSSGNSPNIVRALEASRAIGLESITLTGMRPDNRARTLGDLNFYVDAHRYGWTESAHQIILHHWFDNYLCQHRGGAI
jgi:D-sedoheptulose 7-phosphate isomerase